jgi:hypothetical protein
VGWFLGDSVGGHGWEVQLPDGSIEKVYFDLPPEVADNFEFEFLLSDPPDEHDGRPIEDKSIANLGGLYIAALSRMVDDFVERFKD